MPASKIQYADQIDDGGTTAQGRWTSDNADEVRDVVNEHADAIDGLDASTTQALSRSNHTGSQEASTISDLDTAVSGNADVVAANNKPVSAHYESLFQADGSTFSAKLLQDIQNSAIAAGDTVSWGSRRPASFYGDSSPHGGNSGVIRAAATGTADGASIFDVSTLQIHATFPGESVTVWQCGVVGDDLADDRDDLQLAANIASSLGKKLHFESANCAIAGSVTIPANCAVDAYPGATLRQTSALSSCLRIHAPVTKASVSNLSFIGKGNDYTGASDSLVSAAIDINGAFNVTIDNITTSAFVGCGVRVRGSSSRILIGNSKLIGAGSPEITAGAGFGASVHIDVCSHVSVFNCELSGHAQGLLTGGASSHVHLRNLDIHDIPGQHGIYFGDLTDSTMDRISVDGTFNQGIKIQRTDTLTDLVDDIYCSNLKIRNTGSHGFLVVVPGNGASGGVINRCSGHNIETFDTGEDGIQISDVVGGQWRGLKSHRAAKVGLNTERLQKSRLSDIEIDDAQWNGLSVLACVDVDYDGVRLENVALQDLAASQFGVRITGASSGVRINRLKTSADNVTLMRYSYYCSASGTGQESCTLTNSELFGASDFAARMSPSLGFGEWRGNDQDKGYATTIFPIGDYIKGDLTTERVPWTDSNRNLYHKVTKSGLSYDLLPGGDPRQDPAVNSGPDWYLTSDRASHVGTQTASTISDFDSAVNAAVVHLPESVIEVVGDKTFTLAEVPERGIFISTDMRNGTSTVLLPADLPDGYYLDFTASTFAEGHSVTVGVVNENLNDNNNARSDDGRQRFEGYAGWARWIRDGIEWRKIGFDTFPAEPAFPVDYDVSLPVAAATTVAMEITTEDASSIEVEWQAGVTEDITSGVTASHTYPSAYTGNVGVNFTKNQRPTKLETLTGLWAYSLSDDLPSASRYKTIRELDLRSSGIIDGLIEDTLKYTPELSKLYAIGSNLAIGGSLEEAAQYAKDVRYIIVSGANMTIGGDMAVVAGNGSLLDANFVGGELLVYGDMEQMTENSPGMVRQHFSGNKMIFTGNVETAIANAPATYDCFYFGSLMNFTCNLVSAIANGPSLSTVSLYGLSGVVTVPSPPAFNATMNTIDVSSSNTLTVQEVDDVLKGAENVSTWIGSKVVTLTRNGCPPPSAAGLTSKGIIEGNGATVNVNT